MSYNYVSDGEATPLFNSSAARDGDMGEFPWGNPRGFRGNRAGVEADIAGCPGNSQKNHAEFPQNEYTFHSRPDAPGGLLSDKRTRGSVGLGAGFLLAHSGNG